MKRDYPDRPFAAVGVIVFKQGKVLLIRRNKAPKSQSWSIPGGAQNLGETLLETAKREIKEETGIDIQNITLVDAVDFIDKDNNNDIRYHYSLIDYCAEYKAGDIKAGDDAFEAKWVPLNDIEKYELWTKTLDVIIKARKIINLN